MKYTFLLLLLITQSVYSSQPILDINIPKSANQAASHYLTNCQQIEFASSFDDSKRRALAANPYIKNDAALMLLNDPVDSVVYALAGNKYINKNILRALYYKRDLSISTQLAINTETPVDVLRELSRHGKTRLIKQLAYQNPSLPLEDFISGVDADDDCD